jgi:hypothetical protein
VGVESVSHFELVSLRVRVEALEQDLSEAVHMLYCWLVWVATSPRLRIQTADPWAVEGQVPSNAARILSRASPNRSGQAVR